jgi:hypothetical protein
MARWRTHSGLENSWGFDKNALPPWFMVDLGADKHLMLDFAVGKSVKNLSPRIVEIKELGMDGQSREFQIKGKLPGPPARIEVRDPRTNRLEADLEVSVKRKKRSSISFHFVEDKRGDKTTRKFDEVGDIIRELNGIYTLQTNIIFRSGGAEPLKVDITLDDVVDARENKGEWLTGEAFIYHKQLWRKIFASKGNRMADFNVYFVPVLQPKDNRNDLLFYDGNNCVIEDGSFVPTFVLAHAIGRMLGCAPTSRADQQHHLMFWGTATASYFTPRDANFIPKDCANRMNP